jgi:hypothetical protein
LILEKRRDIKTALVDEIIGEGHCTFGLRQQEEMVGWMDVGFGFWILAAWCLDDFGLLMLPAYLP